MAVVKGWQCGQYAACGAGVHFDKGMKEIAREATQALKIVKTFDRIPAPDDETQQPSRRTSRFRQHCCQFPTSRFKKRRMTSGCSSAG
jgi:hypothetical protein